MIKLTLKAAIIFMLFSCGKSDDNKIELFVSGAQIAGVNGIHFGPDGLLYAASVIGSDISVVDTKTNTIIKRYDLSDGVIGPDDVAFNSKGEFYWTSILTGEVAGFNVKGEKVIAGNPGPGVNPITFSDDDRLFVAQCFFDNGLFEMDPSGQTAPRVIKDEIGEFCGLNGMDWGPDGRLYGPRWFNNEIVSVNVDTAEIRKEVGGLNVPAAVNFNSKGELFILDTGDGKVVKVVDGIKSDYALVELGLDNLAIDANDDVFVSSYSEGSILKVSPDGIEEVLPGGISHAGGIAVAGNDLIVADIQSVKAYSLIDGSESWNYKNVFRISPHGANTSVSTFDDYVILSSWLDNHVKIMRPDTGEILESLDGLNIPVSATKYGDRIAVALQGDKSITLFNVQNGEGEILADGFMAPTHVINYEEDLLVSDRSKGQIIRVNEEGAQEIIVDGLDSPEGIAIKDNSIYIFEGNTGQIKKFTEGQIVVIAEVMPGSPVQSELQPPSMVFNGLAIKDNYLYISGELERSLFRVAL